ncbi:TonB-dependent receptor [Duganella sp. BJB1802]|uniref:TonB-dependent receptor n=1 Tax=Duganella sp. BJB1802 TaxID=2744575 RepID=UPI001592C4B5|nr:TonB-dependent receptor plug domain-containing protein [Duganella sp. BJB1802]NVD69990.1 TonB-dependent receptor [Duganella sp. BJB1802]
MLRKTVLVNALSIAFGTAAMTVAVMQPAMAQSNASGTVYGRVAPGTATTVVLKNLDTNQTRTTAVDASGGFSVSSMPIGRYSVTLMSGGAAGSTTSLEVLAGQGVEAVFSTGVQSVQVTGRRSRIDISSANNGATFTARELDKLPIARNVDAIVQLAPNTTHGDPTYAAGSSLGGGGASENAYYINGFPVTNPLTQLGGFELPFGAIAQAQVLTGGYGAEFGRSVGGVVNITTKSGTNTWEVGGMVSTSPKDTRARYKDMYYANTGKFPYTPATATTPAKGTDGSLRIRREDNDREQNQYSAYVGGPLIKDTLFAFVALEQTEDKVSGVYNGRTALTNASNGWRDYQTNTKRYYMKLDWNINENHRLEYTGLGDLPQTNTQYRSYDYATRAIGSTVNTSTHEEYGPFNANGGQANILRYIGNITDDLTINALYGKSRASHVYTPTGYDPTLAQVTASPENQAPGLNYSGGQPFSTNQPFNGSKDNVISKRLDLEYKLGDHKLRAGLDNNSMSSLNAGDALAGGALWTYLKTDPNKPTTVAGGTVPVLAGRGPLASQGFYVSKTLSSTISNAYAGQDAQYVEDQWQVTKKLLITGGIRREGFYNANQDGTKYIEMKNQIAPRLSAVWDANGDSSFKVFGSAGRYTLQMPTLIALRGANGSLNTSEYYTYTGTDAHGAPTGLTAVTGVLSANNEFGQAKDPKTVAALDMKPSFQDEITLGFEKAYSPDLNFGVKGTYRTLKSTIDDFCDGRVFTKYAKDHNIDTSNYEGFSCASFNPGEANDFLVDYAGTKSNYTRVHLTQSDLGFDKAKRKYAALDFFAEHPYRNGWYGKLNYTLSRSTGNTEGQTLSDTTTGQGDVAATQTWDYAQLMKYADGLLPNDRKHQIKGYGFYEVTPQLTVGGFVTIASGRPRSCSGTNPTTLNDVGYNYQSASHYCFGATGDLNTPSPRGTLGRLPWEKTLDLNASYKPTALPGLTLKVDVFNVFNDQSVQKVVERYNTNLARYALYESVLNMSAPRSMKFSAEFNKKF